MSTVKRKCSSCGLFVTRDGVCRQCDAAPVVVVADRPTEPTELPEPEPTLVRRDPPPDFWLARHAHLTRRTWPARAPTAFAVLAGIGVAVAANPAIGLLAWAGALLGARRLSSRDPRYLDAREELAMWGKKGWGKLAGALYENPLERLEQEDVPPPALIDFRCRRHTEGIEHFWLVARPDRREPANDVPHFSWKLARIRGSKAPELSDVEYAPGGPIVRVDVAFPEGRLGRKITAPVPAPFNVYDVGTLASGGSIQIAPFEAVNPLILVTGESGSGKSSLEVQIASKAILQGKTQVIVLDGGGGGDFEWLKGPDWRHGAEIVTGPIDCKERLNELRDEVAERTRALAEVKIEKDRGEGTWVRTNVAKFADAPDQVIDRLGGWLVVLIDEAHRVVGSQTADKDLRAQRAFQAIATDARKAGVMVMLGIHRADAAMVGGYTRDQFATRINLGKPRRTASRMTHEDEGMHAAAFSLEPTSLPGVGTFEGVGIPPVRRLRHGELHELDRDWLAEVIREAPGKSADEPPRRGGVETPGGPGEAAIEEMPAEAGIGRNEPGRAWWRRLFPVDLWIKQAFWTVPLAWATVVHVGKRDAEVQVQFREDVLAANHGRVRCALCGDSGVLQADHVRPLWAKGANAAHNGQLLCVCCHRRKTGLESLARRIARRRAVWMTAGALLLLVLAKGWG